MFRPFFVFVGSRYTRAKRKNHFISFISLTSMLGIALGVMVLITVLSVMNGFSKEIRSQMLSVAPHITFQQVDGNLKHWKSILKKLMHHPEVTGAAPYVLSYGMLTDNGNTKPVSIRGIEPAAINAVYPLEKSITAGKLTELTSGSFGVVLGIDLASALGVTLGNKITLIVPETTVTIAGVIPRLKTLRVVGIFKSGTHYDNNNIFINLADAAKILRMHGGITGIQLKVLDEIRAPQITKQLIQIFGYKYWITDWTDEYTNYFQAIKMEKTVMTLILLLIIAVAVFNLVSSLVMIVTDKRSDIAIMRAMGASRKSIMGIFVVQGCIIGVIGTVVGLALGLLLASNVTVLVAMLEHALNVKFISEDVYFIGFVPSDIRQLDVLLICVFSLIMSLLATLYPAWQAANIQPAEALRYE
jgi:lipoprotein-releasing system permease protein